MKLVEAKNAPIFKVRGKLQELIEEFADSDIKVAEFTYKDSEYKNRKSADGAIRIAVKRSPYKNIKVRTIDWHIYLFKE